MITPHHSIPVAACSQCALASLTSLGTYLSRKEAYCTGMKNLSQCAMAEAEASEREDAEAAMAHDQANEKERAEAEARIAGVRGADR